MELQRKAALVINEGSKHLLVQIADNGRKWKFLSKTLQEGDDEEGAIIMKCQRCLGARPTIRGKLGSFELPATESRVIPVIVELYSGFFPSLLYLSKNVLNQGLVINHRYFTFQELNSLNLTDFTRDIFTHYLMPRMYHSICHRLPERFDNVKELDGFVP